MRLFLLGYGTVMKHLFCTSVSSQKLLARHGTRTMYEIGGVSGWQFITVHCAGNTYAPAGFHL